VVSVSPRAVSDQGPSPALTGHGSRVLEINYRALGSIKINSRNARAHSDAQVAELAISIARFGFVNPVLIDKAGVLIAGEGRYRAARRLGLSHVPAIELSDLSDAQAQALGLADNRIALNSSWDDEILRSVLEGLGAAGEEIAGLGFDDNELGTAIEAATKRNDDADTSPQLEGLSYSIVIRCMGENNQRELLARFEREGLKCSALMS
jgi:ParB-like chromosome segregation protein Spo0J